MSYKVDFFLRSHPKLDALLLSLFPLNRLWIAARAEWSVCRTFNDGPDDCYLPWKEYWKKEVSGYVGK